MPLQFQSGRSLTLQYWLSWNYIDQAGLKLVLILQALPLEYWDFRCAPPHPILLANPILTSLGLLLSQVLSMYLDAMASSCSHPPGLSLGLNLSSCPWLSFCTNFQSLHEFLNSSQTSSSHLFEEGGPAIRQANWNPALALCVWSGGYLQLTLLPQVCWWEFDY